MQSAFPKTLFSLGKVDFWETTLILQTIKVILSNHTRETPCSSFRMDAVLFGKSWKFAWKNAVEKII